MYHTITKQLWVKYCLMNDITKLHKNTYQIRVHIHFNNIIISELRLLPVSFMHNMNLVMCIGNHKIKYF